MPDPKKPNNLVILPAPEAASGPDEPPPASAHPQDNRRLMRERRMVTRKVLAQADFQTRRAAIFGMHLAMTDQKTYRRAQREIRAIADEIAEDARAARRAEIVREQMLRRAA